MREWKVARSETIYEHSILDLERRELTADEGRRREVVVMRAPGWINVVPLLDDGRVVLVRQWRYGIQAPSLEIPGGMVEPGENSRQAAARELVEETGYRAGDLRELGALDPNPAFIDTRLTVWLATGLESVGGERELFGVEGEEIRRELVALSDIPGLIRTGEIRHALVIAAFHLLDLDS